MSSIPYIVEDLGGVIQIFSDGSIHRRKPTDSIVSPIKDDHNTSVIWKDYCYDPSHNLHLRLYKPKPTTAVAGAKLPVIYYLHGGGFCVGSFSRAKYHNFCLRISEALHAVVVAPNCRLAPEHRLPAAIDDSFGALKWLQAQAGDDDGGMWGGGCFDFDRCLVIGDSSGGNLAHHLAVRLGRGSPELVPVRIRGYVMLAPFFGGTERTKSEAEGLPEKTLNVGVLDMCWRMSLPIGKTTDHPFSNPFGPESQSLELVQLDPILLIVGGGEIMKDRVKLYANRLKELKKTTSYIEIESKQHGFLNNEPYSDASALVLSQIKDFMYKHFG